MFDVLRFRSIGRALRLLPIIAACIALPVRAGAAPRATGGGHLPTKVRIRNGGAGLDRAGFAIWFRDHPGMDGLAREDDDIRKAGSDAERLHVTSAAFDACDLDHDGIVSARELKDYLLRKAAAS